MQEQLLIVHQGAIGDVILSLPALHTIKSAFPHHFCEALGHPDILTLLINRFYLNAVVSVHRAMFARLYTNDSLVDPELKAYFSRFDYVFLFGGTAHTAVAHTISTITAARVVRIDPFPTSEPRHVVDYQLEQLQQLGFSPSTTVPVLFPTDEDMKKAVQFLASYNLSSAHGPIIAMHPGSGSPRKNWPAEHVIVFLRHIIQRITCTILLIEGPADDHICRRIEHACAGMRLCTVRHLDLSLLAAILKHCTLYIGNDSGITHIAAALGVPTIALFGPTNPQIWAPRGSAVCVLHHRADHEGWKWPDPDHVLKTVLSMLSGERQSDHLPGWPRIDKSLFFT
ncbi:MAG: glycosyltransferase family 9 protein [Desulfobacterota bacterium]|nr:glycosyltransferase family 9 protein [Thermodesulfobacteriota bacterium]